MKSKGPSEGNSVKARIAANIVAARLAAGLTQSELALACHKHGWRTAERSKLVKIETGARGVYVEELLAIAQACGVDARSML